MSNSGVEFKFKVLLLGDCGVGKTSLVGRLTRNTFSESYLGTVGIEYAQVDIAVAPGVDARLQIWDTAGQERFKSLVESYYRGAQGIAIVYDVTDENSFQHVSNWISHMEASLSSSARFVHKFLVANKRDMGNPHRLSERGRRFANKNDMPFYEVSAKTGQDVKTLFQGIADSIYLNSVKMSASNTEEQQNIQLKEAPKKSEPSNAC